MSVTIRAIETPFDGHRFRSRLEARWAVFFKTLRIKYEYEKEGFNLGDGVLYLPDFWLPEQQCWIEIKGGGITPEEAKKARLLAEQSEYPVFVFAGQIELVKISKNEKGTAYLQEGISARYFEPNVPWKESKINIKAWFWATCLSCHAVDIVGLFRNGTVSKKFCACSLPVYSSHDQPLQGAYDAARGARFEHGESGYWR